MSEEGGVANHRSRLITIAIGLVVLAIFASIAYKLPEADTWVTGYLCVGDIIKLVLLFIMLGMVLSARPPLATVATYYAHSGFKTKEYPERKEVATDITGLASEIANVIVIAILWSIVVKIVNTLLLMDVERTFDWVSILVTVAFVAILLWRLYLAYQSLKLVLDVMGGGKAKLSCPKCGKHYYGWATLDPERQTCPECGSKLEIYQGKKGN